MRDGDIRLALDAVLERRHAGEPETLIRHEMGICAGKRRVDVALLNGELAGYEIKSDEDTLSRLGGQSADYGRVFDRVTLVTTARHQKKAMRLVPKWWGIIVARQEGGEAVLEEIRQPRMNPDIEPFALAQLLWRDEVLEELRSRGLAKGMSKKARYYLWMALSEKVAIQELRDLVRERVKARPEWLAGPLYARSGGTLPTAATA